MGLGTWYPEGGMGALAKALQKIAEKNGVRFHFNAPITAFDCEGSKIVRIKSGDQSIDVEHVIVGADYNFVEQNLIPEKFRRYNKNYWNKRRLAPSCLIFYIGIDKKIEGLEHHNLFFDEDLVAHGKDIYDHPKWPEKPLFYTCVPSKTDDKVAPENAENLFLLIPIAPNLEDSDEMREHYYNLIMKRVEKHTNTDIIKNVVYKRSYCIADFKEDYNSYKGNAYGLANTLKQTANLKPKITSKLTNLLFCGQLTVPGPGMPPALISGKIVAKHLIEKN
jgi:phytoene desaturase